ncbi:hypothetical protein J6590_102585, partial [Homalodisca vitripennis]
DIADLITRECDPARFDCRGWKSWRSWTRADLHSSKTEIHSDIPLYGISKKRGGIYSIYGSPMSGRR